MTKDELERIKQAYYSGLKVQIWFDGYWENFDVRDYSMYSDPFSENRLYRIVGSAYADIAEKRIAELEQTNKQISNECHKLVDTLEKKQKEIEELKKENAELKAENQRWKDEWQEQVQKANDEGYARTLQTIQLTKANEIIKNLLTLSIPIDYAKCPGPLQKIAEAEQFLKEVEK